MLIGRTAANARREKSRARTDFGKLASFIAMGGTWGCKVSKCSPAGHGLNKKATKYVYLAITVTLESVSGIQLLFVLVGDVPSPSHSRG